MTDKAYTPKGDHFDSSLSDKEKALIKNYQKQWLDAYNKGDQRRMDAAHAGAEGVRLGSSTPYSGGSDGTQFIGMGVAPSKAAPDYGHVSQPASYTPSEIPKAKSGEEYITAIYKAQEDAALNSLKAAYEKNVLALDKDTAEIPKIYADARNKASSQQEVAKAAFNEYAAGQGLSSGAGGQARLAMDNALLGNLSAAHREEAKALSDREQERLQLKTAYNNSIADAVAQGRLQLARDLHEEFARLDKAEIERAKTLADERYRAFMSGR